MSTWMVVEDEPDLYDTLLALFEIWSIDGVAFTNGTDAIKWVDDVDHGVVDSNLPELALLDIRLPGATGPEIGKRLRKSPHLKNMTIVLMTAFHLSLDEEKSVMSTAGADTLIYKPLPAPAEFRALLQRAITGRSIAQAEKAATAEHAAVAPAPEAKPTPAPTARKPAGAEVKPAPEPVPAPAPKAAAPSPAAPDKSETPTKPAPPKPAPPKAAATPPKPEPTPTPPPVKQTEDDKPPQ